MRKKGVSDIVNRENWQFFMQKILERLSEHLRQAISGASFLAEKTHSKEVFPEHLLLAILSQKGSVAAEICKKYNLTPEIFQKIFESSIPVQKEIVDIKNHPHHTHAREFSLEAIHSLTRAFSLAHTHQSPYVGSEHLLCALLGKPSTRLEEFLREHNILTGPLLKQFEFLLENTSRFGTLSQLFPQAEKTPTVESPSVALSFPLSPVLDQFGRELTNPLLTNEMDPIIGRHREIDRIIHILSRRTKNNPILLGEAGVGKTAIVEGLAKHIMEGKVPPIFQYSRIYALDTAQLVAGAMMRGDFEYRLKRIIEEIENHPDMILFIDEIHTIVGIGSGGTLDMANILKPALARGRLRCIGATTLSEYKKHIEADDALARRFEPLIISEPNSEETQDILFGLRPYYEQFHRVKISDKAIQSTVTDAERFFPQRLFPDKAIDLLDETAARMRVVHTKEPNMVQSLKKEQQNLYSLEIKKMNALKNEHYSEAVKLAEHITHSLFQLQTLEQEITEEAFPLVEVHPKDIRDTITLLLGNKPKTPFGAIENFPLLEKELRNLMVSQNEAIRVVLTALKRYFLGLTPTHRPIGTFLFLGPSGVGKSYLAKMLAETFFGGSDALIRIDLGEFQESHSISKLIGSPAGYVGYRDTNQLTDRVKKEPHSVILFDEIEKAHPDVHNLLLKVLEDAALRDATGKEVDFSHCLIIMTSNVAAELFKKQETLGFAFDFEKLKEEKKSKNKAEILDPLKKELEEYFRPEFLDRIHSMVLFDSLKEKDLKQIIRKEFEKIVAYMRGQNIVLETDSSLFDALSRECFLLSEGARITRKVIEEKIENPLTDILLQKNAPKKIFIETKKDQLIFRAT